MWERCGAFEYERDQNGGYTGWIHYSEVAWNLLHEIHNS